MTRAFVARALITLVVIGPCLIALPGGAQAADEYLKLTATFGGFTKTVLVKMSTSSDASFGVFNVDGEARAPNGALLGTVRGSFKPSAPGSRTFLWLEVPVGDGLNLRFVIRGVGTNDDGDVGETGKGGEIGRVKAEFITAAVYSAGPYFGTETTQSGVCGGSELPVDTTWQFGPDATLRVTGPFTRVYTLTTVPGGTFTGTGTGGSPDLGSFTATVTGQVDGDAAHGREILSFPPGPDQCPGGQTVLDFKGESGR